MSTFFFFLFSSYFREALSTIFPQSLIQTNKKTPTLIYPSFFFFSYFPESLIKTSAHWLTQTNMKTLKLFFSIILLFYFVYPNTPWVKLHPNLSYKPMRKPSLFFRLLFFCFISSSMKNKRNNKAEATNKSMNQRWNANSDYLSYFPFPISFLFIPRHWNANEHQEHAAPPLSPPPLPNHG